MKKVKLFRNGRSQAVRIPKEFRLEGSREVSIRREGKSLVIEPVEEFSWSGWWKSWKPLGEAFMPEGRRPTGRSGRRPGPYAGHQ